MSPQYLTEGTKSIKSSTSVHESCLQKQRHMHICASSTTFMLRYFPCNAILQRKTWAKRVISLPEVLQGRPIWGSELSEL